MKTKKTISLILVGIMFVAVGLTGCSRKGTNTSTKISLDKNQYINIPIATDNIKTLDPSKSIDTASGYVLQESMEALAREEVKDGKDILVPAGAEKWEVSADGKTWTFHLRKNKWSDNKEVTAAQYVYSIKRTLDPTVASNYAYLLVGAGIKGAGNYNSKNGTADGVGVKAVDDLTLEITLDRPCAYFEKLLANRLFLPQRQDIVEKYGNKYGTTYDTLLYNGPFKITELQAGNKVVMIKNETYWDKNSVKLSKITMPFMKDETSRTNAFQKKEIDSVIVDNQEVIEKFKQSDKSNEITSDGTNVYFNFYNTTSKYFKNAKIRRAFSLALDREDYFKLIAKGMGKPAYSWVPYPIQIGNDVYRSKVPEQLKSSKEDPKVLLAEGLKEIGADANQSKMVIDYLLPGTDAANKEQGNYMQNSLKTKLGVTVKCNYMEWTQYLAQRGKGGYDMCFANWVADYNDPMAFFALWQTGSKIENNGWSNKEYDALIEDAKNTMDQSKRIEDFKKAEKILIQDEASISPSYFQGKSEFIAKYVKDAQTPLFSMGEELKYAYTSGRGK